MSLLIVGTVAFDKIETPLGKTEKILGGAGTYIGIAASYFTDTTNIVSVIGDDFPDKYHKILKTTRLILMEFRLLKLAKPSFGKVSTILI